jgi:predicted amidohydrolase
VGGAGAGRPAGIGASGGEPAGGAAGSRGAGRPSAGGAAPFADGLRLYNSAVLVTPDGGPVGLYRKVHLFDR